MNLLKYITLNKFIPVILLLLFKMNSTASAQSVDGDSLCKLNIRFAEYLIQKSQYDNALYLLNDTSLMACVDYFDEINYLKGWTYYYKKDLKKSTFWLNNVSAQSPRYLKSRFYSFYNHAHLGELSSADSVIRAIDDTSDVVKQLLNLELAGLSLLKRDMKEFDQRAAMFKSDYYYFELQQKELLNTKDNILKTKKKSKYLAGGLSAVVPGLGKVYGGKIGEGVAAFSTVGGLAAITIECYLKYGITDFRTLAFGSLFSLFYAGNIYGSMITIQQYKNEVTQSQNLTILYQMHIPMRALFE